MRRVVLWVVPLLSTPALWVVGCSQQSNRLPAQTRTVASGATPGTYTPQGPFPRGQASGRVGPEGPEVGLVAPLRGTQVSAGVVDVELAVVDPDGVASVTVEGAPAQAAGGDRFRASVALVPGLNVVRFEAVDGLGAKRSGYVAVSSGEHLPGGAEVPAACRVELGQAGLDRIAREVEQAARTLDLLALVNANGRPVVNTGIVKVDVTSIAHDPPRVAAFTPTATGLGLALELDRLRVELDVDLIGNGQVVLEADRARVEAGAAIRPASGPATGATLLGLAVERIDLVFTGLRLQARSTLANLLLAPIRGIVLAAMERALESALRNAVGRLLARPLPGVDAPLVVNVPAAGGTTAALELKGRITGGRGWPGRALELEAALAVVASNAAFPGASAGFLVTRPAPPQVTPVGVDEAQVALSVDAANGFAHAWWQTGAAAWELDGTRPTTAAVPLSARLLHPFLPLALELAPDPATPVVIRASVVDAPPALRVAAGGVGIVLPELELSVWLDYMDGGPRVELLRARVTLEAGVAVAVGASELVLSDLTLGAFAFDLVAEPSGPVDDQQLEEFVRAVLPLLLPEVKLPSIPIPALPAAVPLVTPILDLHDGWVVVRGRVQ